MKTRDKKGTTTKRFLDALRAAFKARDEEAFNSAMEMADEMTEGTGLSVEGDGGGAGPQTLVIKVEGAAPAVAETTDDEPPAEKKEDEAPAWFTSARAEDKTWRDGMESRLAKLEGGATTDEDTDEDDDEMTEDGDELDEGEVEAGSGRTTDSVSLSAAFQEMIARGEILAPGIKLPTFDGKVERKKTKDRMCAFRRRALVKALADEDTAAILAPIAGRKPDIAKLTCDGATMMFNAAAELVKNNNTSGMLSGFVHDGDRGTKAAPTIADINKRNHEHWVAKGGLVAR